MEGGPVLSPAVPDEGVFDTTRGRNKRIVRLLTACGIVRVALLQPLLSVQVKKSFQTCWKGFFRYIRTVQTGNLSRELVCSQEFI